MDFTATFVSLIIVAVRHNTVACKMFSKVGLVLNKNKVTPITILIGVNLVNNDKIQFLLLRL